MLSAQDKLDAASDAATEAKLAAEAEAGVVDKSNWIDKLERFQNGLFVEYKLLYKLMPVLDSSGNYADDEYSGLKALRVATTPYGEFIRNTLTHGDRLENGQRAGIIAIRMSQIVGLTRKPAALIDRLHSEDVQRLIMIVEEVMLGELGNGVRQDGASAG